MGEYVYPYFNHHITGKICNTSKFIVFLPFLENSCNFKAFISKIIATKIHIFVNYALMYGCMYQDYIECI